MNGQSTIATDEDLFAGFGSYVSTDEIGMFEDGMADANFSPLTPITPSSTPCLQVLTSVAWETWNTPC